MNYFLIALITVAIMLLYAFPGYLLVKTKFVKEEAISAFAKVLMYVCQPCLTVYSFLRVDFSKQVALDLLFVFVFVFVILFVSLITFRLAFRKKKEDAKIRVYNIAICFSNFAFMGIPVLEALLPDYPEAVALTAAAGLAMNMIGFTLASAIIANDRKYVRINKILFNPATLALIFVLPFFITGVQFPKQIDDAITILARMTTPLCMLIMGMRLACIKFVSLFTNPINYLIIGIKQLVLPLIVWLILLIFPVDINVKTSLYIMFCCPIASVVLNFAEITGSGQDTAANLLLLGTGLSIVTIPVMVLIL